MATGQRKLFCFGYGFVARHLAGHLIQQGWQVSGTSRSAEKCETMQKEGIEAHQFGDDHPLDDPASALAGVTHVVHSIISGEEGDVVFRHHGPDLAALQSLEWLAYLGTTAVYGDQNGEWVDEATPVAPTSDRARRRVNAEGAWLASGLPVHIFRLAGIYGPGRNAIEVAIDGKSRRIRKPGQVFSRIHVDDIVTTLTASIDRPNPQAIYNVCDDEPAPASDVTDYACGLVGVAPPPWIDHDSPDLSAMARTFYADNRRVSNDRMRHELGVTLRYPTYRIGLDALFEGMNDSKDTPTA